MFPYSDYNLSNSSASQDNGFDRIEGRKRIAVVNHCKIPCPSDIDSRRTKVIISPEVGKTIKFLIAASACIWTILGNNEAVRAQGSVVLPAKTFPSTST